MNVRELYGFPPNIELKPDKRKPTHGECCTCQKCGYYHDDCTCDDNVKKEVINYVEQLEVENKRLKDEVEQLKDTVGVHKPIPIGNCNPSEIGYKVGDNCTGQQSVFIGRKEGETCKACGGTKWIGGVRLSDNAVKGGQPCSDPCHEKPPMEGMVWEDGHWVMTPRTTEGCLECFDHPAVKPYCKRCNKKEVKE